MSYDLGDLRIRARRGWVYQARAAYWLGLQGFDVHLQKFEIRDEDESPDRFRGEEDLRVGVDGLRYEAVEVKSKAATFGAEPASFPFEEIFLYSTRKGRRDLPVLLFSSMGQGGPPLGFCDDGRERVVRMASDPRRGIEYPVWAAPKSLLVGLAGWCELMRRKLVV